MSTENSHLNTATAAPRLAPAETAMAHNVSEQKTHFTVNMAADEDGFMSGEAHITGPQLSRMLGQTTVDLAHLAEISFDSAATNIGCAVGGHFEHGRGDTAATFSTMDRAMHVNSSGNVTACHLVVGPSCGSGNVQVYQGLGSLKPAHTLGTHEDTRSAIGRSLRWAGQDHTNNLSGACLKVGLGPAVRYLVPNDKSEQKCAMSTLFGVNATKDDFCGGRYTTARATKAVCPQGRECTVVTAEDFATVKDALLNRFSEKNPLMAGLTLKLKSFSQDDHALGTELTEAGFQPHINLVTTFKRALTKDFLGSEQPAQHLAVTRTDMHELLGEDATTAALIAKQTGSTTADSFAKQIMALSLSGGGVADTTAPHMASAKVTVEAGASELQLQPSD